MSDNEDNLVETTGLICDVDKEIELVKAAKNELSTTSIAIKATNKISEVLEISFPIFINI
jgi:hypothetical protein